MNLDTVLSAIGATEASDFSEFCRGLGDDCPQAGERDDWRELFNLVREGERLGLIFVVRDGRDIKSLQLTRAGADRVRAKLDAKRPLFGAIKQAGG